jgi:hypothetical protein
VSYELSSSADDTVPLRHVLGALLTVPSDLTKRLEERLAAAGASLQQLVDVYHRWLDDPSKDRRSSQRLRQMLEDEMPRRPVDVPTYAPDRVGTGEDLIGIRREVDAFAYLLASKAQRPPLAVGLFGDWGSGKSFFMNAVKNRIAVIEDQVKDLPQQDVPFWKNIRQIEFNAWEYVQGNLWASLIDNIFCELDGQGIDIVRDRHNELETAQLKATEDAEAQAAKRQKPVDEIAGRKAAVAVAEFAREAKRTELVQERTKKIEEELDAAQRNAFGLQAAALAGKDATELAAAVGEARAALLRGRGLLGPYWTGWRIGVATLVAFAIPAVARIARPVLDGVADRRRDSGRARDPGRRARRRSARVTHSGQPARRPSSPRPGDDGTSALVHRLDAQNTRQA